MFYLIKVYAYSLEYYTYYIGSSGLSFLIVFDHQDRLSVKNGQEPDSWCQERSGTVRKYHEQS